MFSGSYFQDKNERAALLKNSREIVKYLSHELGERTLRKYDNLNRARDYINAFFSMYGKKHGYPQYEDTYIVQDKEVANIITEIKGSEEPEKIILIGAHYDTVEDSPGADDNATAIAGLLEFFRLFAGTKQKKTIRFVAFTLEEPPFFSTEDMGSMRYAANCQWKKENIELMVCLEMLGYGSKKCKQDFPSDDYRKLGPKHGNFLTVCSLPSISDYVYLWKRMYNSYAKTEIVEMIGPASVPGIGLSDHFSFVKNGYPAIMLCDTGFYRNKNYHMPEDTFDTINYKFLVDNIFNSYLTIKELANMDKLLDK
ncbi:MAG: M28 family peptidase [bacterium]|nr:M28 family peptidase [bacterium]